MPANMSQRDLLAWTIAGEAGRESRTGQDAVAHNIINRAYSGRFPASVEGVIMQPGQYSMWNDVTGYAGGAGGNSQSVMARTSPSAFANYQAVADDALSGRTIDPTGGSLNYYNPNVASPSWGAGSSRWTSTGDIGNHTFGVAGGAPYDGSNPDDPRRANSYTPEYNNFSPSGYDYAGDVAPGSFNDTMPTNIPYENFSKADNSLTQQEGSFTTHGGINGHFQPGIEPMTGAPWSTDKNSTETAPVDPSVTDKPSSTIEDASYIKGDTVTDPKAAAQGQGTTVPQAIVTAANQEAKTVASAAKTTAEATLNATKTQTASDAKLQGAQQGFVANWAVRIFLFIIGAIFIGGALFLFGGQAIFSQREPA